MLLNLTQGLFDHEHIVGFFSQPEEKYINLRPDLQVLGISNFFIDYRTPGFRENLRRKINEIRPDIILRHWWKGFSDQRITPKEYPTILIVHDTNPAPSGYDCSVILCQYSYHAQSHLPKKKMVLIRNGIDTRKYDLSKISHDGFVIGRVSSLNRSKIPRDWVHFTCSFHIPGVRFVIAGEGERRSELLADVRALRAEDRYELPGIIRDVPALLRGFDMSCYVTSTHVEIHSMSLLEKAAAGIPIVAQPRGGIPEQVIHGKTGFLSHHLHEIRKYCEKLFREPRLLEDMSGESRRFSEEFTLEKQCRAYQDVIRSLV